MLKNLKDLWTKKPSKADPVEEAPQGPITPITTVLPEAECPACHTLMDAATGNREPKEGDLSLCVYCGAALEFTKEMKVALISEATWGALPDDQKQGFVRASKRVSGNKSMRHEMLMRKVTGSVEAWREAQKGESDAKSSEQGA